MISGSHVWERTIEVDHKSVNLQEVIADFAERIDRWRVLDRKVSAVTQRPFNDVKSNNGYECFVMCTKSDGKTKLQADTTRWTVTMMI